MEVPVHGVVWPPCCAVFQLVQREPVAETARAASLIPVGRSLHKEKTGPCFALPRNDDSDVNTSAGPLPLLGDYPHTHFFFSNFPKEIQYCARHKTSASDYNAPVPQLLFPSLYLKFRFWIKPKLCEPHPCIHPQIPAAEPPPSRGGGDGWPASDLARRSRSRPALAAPASLLPPAWSSHDAGAGNSSNPALTSQTDLPSRWGPQMPSDFFFFVKGRKTAPRRRRTQHRKKYYSIMLFHLFNIGGIMTKSKQNQGPWIVLVRFRLDIRKNFCTEWVVKSDSMILCFCYSGWFFIFPVPPFAFCGLSSD